MADKVSYFSRFTAKFVEITAAGIATAVSGYMVAHLSGYWFSPAPPATVPAVVVEVAPHAGGVLGNLPAQPAPPVSAETNAQRPTPVQDSGALAVRPARTMVSGAQAAPVPKHAAIDTKAAETKRREAAAAKRREAAEAKRREAAEAKLREAAAAKRREAAEAKLREAAAAKPREAAAAKPREAAVAKPRGAVETKPRPVESVEAEVRAALAKVDASRPSPPGVPPRQADIPRGPPRVGTQPPPVDASRGAGAVAAAPPAADIALQPAQQAPLQPHPLATVEIKSLPVAAVGPSPPPAAQEDASKENAPKENAQSQGTGLFSAIEKIPNLLRSDTPVPADQAPRPPLPVGQ